MNIQIKVFVKGLPSTAGSGAPLVTTKCSVFRSREEDGSPANNWLGQEINLKKINQNY